MNATDTHRQPAGLLIPAIVIFTIVAIFAYLMVRTVLFFVAPYFWYEKLTAFVLLLAEGFILLHSFGYFLNLLHVIRRPVSSQEQITPVGRPKDYPAVAIIVSSYKEPISVVEDIVPGIFSSVPKDILKSILLVWGLGSGSG